MARSGWFKLLVAGLATLGVAASCTSTTPGQGPATDDSPVGDSLPPGTPLGDGKTDGFGVPSSLGLDKRGIVYLTFDDGPSRVYTPRILETLAAHGVKATFFLTGINIAGNEDLVRREAAEGHIVANHQWEHVIADPSQFQGWVVRERELIESLAGVQPLYFRYPYGAMEGWKEDILKAEGYVHGGIGWDVDSLDWDFGPDEWASRPEVPAGLAGDFVGWVVSQVEARGGGVILFHDIQSVTARHLDTIIRTLKARGYAFGSLPGAGAAPVVPPPAPPSEDACGGVTYEGFCEGATVVWCENGQLRNRDCAALGQVCGFKDPYTGYACVPGSDATPPAEGGCENETAAGRCDGETLIWCENDRKRVVDCSARGQTCGYRNDEIGWDCL